MRLFFQELDSLHFNPEHHPHLALQAWELICTKRCHAKSSSNITEKKNNFLSECLGSELRCDTIWGWMNVWHTGCAIINNQPHDERWCLLNCIPQCSYSNFAFVHDYGTSQNDSLFSSVSVSPSLLRTLVFSSSSCTDNSLWLTDDSFWISSTDFSKSLGWNVQKDLFRLTLCA